MRRENPGSALGGTRGPDRSAAEGGPQGQAAGLSRALTGSGAGTEPRRVGAEPRKGREGVWGMGSRTPSPQERGESADRNALPACGVWLPPSETMPTIL